MTICVVLYSALIAKHIFSLYLLFHFLSIEPSYDVLLVEEIAKCCVYFNTEVGGQKFHGNAVAVSSTKALTALHGLVPPGPALAIRDSRGKGYHGRVGLSVFEADKHDIAVITLLGGHRFTHFKPFSRTAVKLGQALHIFSYTRDIHDHYRPAYKRTYVATIEDGTSLFQSEYYSTEGMSGCGVLVSDIDGDFSIAGVHVASHDKNVAVHARRGEKSESAEYTTYHLDMVTMNSNIHGHGAYTLICEPARVPDVVAFVDAN
jgi:hypothetical protein